MTQMKKAILLVSYGIANKVAWEKSLGVLEEEIRGLWPEWKVYQAFTGRRIIERCWAQGFEIPSEEQAVQKLLGEGYEEILVLPTHLTFGSEYNKIVTALEDIPAESEIGLPLLGSEILHRRVVEAVIQEIPLQDGETLLCVGHGVKQDDSKIYEMLEEEFHKAGQTSAIVGTLETIDSALERIGSKKVMVFPLFLTAGKHALQDVCGEGENSVVSRLRTAGFDVCCVKTGLIEYQSIRRIYLDQLEELVRSFVL